MSWNWGRPFHRHKASGGIIRETNNPHRYYNEEGELIMAIQAGGTDNFQFGYTPAGSSAPAGTTLTWSVDDTADITPGPNPNAPTDPTQIQATCVANPTGTSFNLTCTSSYTPPGASGPIVATLNVAIQPGTSTNLPTGGVINELGSASGVAADLKKKL